MERINDWIYRIVSGAVFNGVDRIRENQLNHTADLARLIVDAKNDNLSLQSRGFLMRMNIHPDSFKKVREKK